MTVPGFFQAYGTDSYTVISSYLYGYGTAFCTYWLVTTERNREPGKASSEDARTQTAKSHDASTCSIPPSLLHAVNNHTGTVNIR